MFFRQTDDLCGCCYGYETTHTWGELEILPSQPPNLPNGWPGGAPKSDRTSLLMRGGWLDLRRRGKSGEGGGFFGYLGQRAFQRQRQNLVHGLHEVKLHNRSQV